MKMSENYICCENCFENIARKSTKAAILWMELCGMQLYRDQLLLISQPETPEIRLLENKGYIITSENETHFGLKMIGHCKTEDEEDFFCPYGGNHE